MINRVFGATGLLLLALVSLAQEQAQEPEQDEWRSWPLSDRFLVRADLFFPKLDTKIRVDASDGTTGTTIDFEQNLGMSDTETLGGIGFGWRFAKKHRLRLDHFNLDRSGSAITPTEIKIGDEVFNVDLPISSFLDMSVTSLAYSYSIIFDEKKELALLAGLSVQDISFGLVGNGNQGILEFDAGLTAPLPTFGVNGGYAFTDKWVARAAIGIFAFDFSLSDQSELSGDVRNAVLSIQHNTFENVHFGLSYSYFHVNVDRNSETLLKSIDYQYHGPMLTVAAVF
jgi:hypothetical protein